MVRAMETIARNINDEEVFEGWLCNGVADGDINDDTPDDYLTPYFEDNQRFKELMECFMRVTRRAYASGGLYCDDVVADLPPKKKQQVFIIQQCKKESQFKLFSLKNGRAAAIGKA